MIRVGLNDAYSLLRYQLTPDAGWVILKTGGPSGARNHWLVEQDVFVQGAMCFLFPASAMVPHRLPYAPSNCERRPIKSPVAENMDKGWIADLSEERGRYPGAKIRPRRMYSMHQEMYAI